MFKKIVLVSSIAFTCLALIAGIYFLLFWKSKPTPQPTPAQIIVETPTIIADNLVFISQTPYLDVTLSPDGRKIRYFDQSSQSFIEAEFSGTNPVKLLDTDFKNVVDIIWSPDKSKVIALLDKKGVKRYQFINLNSGEKIAYPPEWRSPAFSPTSDKIAYNFLNPKKNINKIEIADVSGKNWQEISKIRIQDLDISWPQNGKLALSSRASALHNSALFLLGITENKLQKIIPESYGLEVLWSPNGNKVIFSSVNKDGKDLKLKLADILSGESEDLEISTFAAKCSWSSDNRTIFCAVPFEWPDIKLTLPDDYWRRTFFTYDHIIKIDINTKQKEVVFSAGTNSPDIRNLFLSSREEYLFFTNKKDGLFYIVRL